MTFGKEETGLFSQSKWLFRGMVFIVFLIGIVIRFYDLTDPPLDFHPTRQLHSALIARGMYYENLESAPEWKRETAVRQWKLEGLIEPPIMERLSAFTYRLVGQENLIIPRIYAIVFWLLGGVGILSLAKEIVGKNGAIFALAYFLVMPYTAQASRSFQPESLMVAAIIFALFAIVRWQRTQNWKWAVLAGFLGGISIFIKSVAVFPIAFSFATVILVELGFLKAIRNRQIWVMATLTVLPYIIYHIYGVYIVGQLGSEFSLRFFPQLWKDPGFWLRWNNMINTVIGIVFFLAAILGTFLLKRKTDRAMLIALWAGYFLYGMTLSYHISTHDYYQLPLVPVVALGSAAVFNLVVESVKGYRWLSSAAILAVIGYFLLINAWDVRVTLKRSDFRNEAQFWTNLADIFQPDDQIIGITQDYGTRMAYWGWRTPTNWMSSSDFAIRELAGQEFDMESYFYEQIEGKDYFLVTQVNELDHQPKIKHLLEDNFSIFKQTSDYIIFDLHNTVN